MRAIQRDLDAEADEALERARSMPSGPEKIEALKKGWAAAQGGRCPGNFIRETWKAA
jgi:hypothetical protein